MAAQRGSPLNKPWQDEAGAWCCPRCQRASFKSHMSVVGHMRTCRVEDMTRPVVLGPVSSSPYPGPSSMRPASPEDAPPWFASAMMRLDSRLAASEARVQQLERYTGNHLTHARMQLAGAGGAARSSSGLWGLEPKHILFAVLGVAALFVMTRDGGGDALRRGADNLASVAKMGNAVKTLKGFLS